MAKPDISIFAADRNQCKPCLVADAIEKLEGPDRELLIAGLNADPHRAKTGKIRDWLWEDHGIEVSVPAITTHRSKRCMCARGR